MKPITAKQFAPDMLTNVKYFWNRKSPAHLAMAFNDDDQDTLLAIAQNNKKIFSLVSTTIPTLHGWASLEKALTMAAIALAIKPSTSVEIGVWAGRSLLPVAWAVEANGSGKVIGIDPFSPQESAKNEFAGHETWWGEQDHAIILKTFQGTIARFNLGGIVQLIQKPSDEVTPPVCQLLHIDGNHTDQAVRDAERFGAQVPLGGVVVMDDLVWVGGGVLRAIDTLENMGFVECFRNVSQSWNVMQKVK